MGALWMWDPQIGEPMDMGPHNWGCYGCGTPRLGTLLMWDPDLGTPILGNPGLGALWM